jgi:type IV secretory pathway VirB10-like protein
MKAKRIALALAALLLTLGLLTGCGKTETPAPAPAHQQTTVEPVQPAEPQTPAVTIPDPDPQPQVQTLTPQPDPAPEPEPEPEPPETAPEDRLTVEEDGRYYDPDHVVLYLHTYGRLPSNYITKKEARKLGWSGGTPEKYREGAAIGGDRFGNREGLLPDAEGRTYTECDLNTLGQKKRGAERLLFSNDGLYFYTGDHYETYTELTVNEKGEVVWMN